MKSFVGIGLLLSTVLLATGGVRCSAQNSSQDPALKQRSDAPVRQNSADAARYAIDVVVTDKAGQSVTGLSAQDFELSDNKQPQKILSFSSVDKTVVKTALADSPASAVKVSSEPLDVLLVVDTVNVGLTEQGLMRDQAEKYLRSNGGKLAAPTRLFFFTSAGMQVQNRSTLDGNALADLLVQLGSAKRVQNSAMGANGAMERFQLSVQNFSSMVANVANQPGRKLMLWLGPGWPMIPNSRLVYNQNAQVHNFDTIVSFLNRLREARIEVVSVRDHSNSNLYQEYLKPVKRLQDADSAALGLPVLAIKSGGQVTDPGNDMAGEIAKCVDEASSYYTLRYTPSVNEKPLSYHAIEVKVKRPDVVVRNVAGYYEAP